MYQFPSDSSGGRAPSSFTHTAQIVHHKPPPRSWPGCIWQGALGNSRAGGLHNRSAQCQGEGPCHTGREGKTGRGCSPSAWVAPGILPLQGWAGARQPPATEAWPTRARRGPTETASILLPRVRLHPFSPLVSPRRLAARRFPDPFLGRAEGSEVPRPRFIRSSPAGKGCRWPSQRPLGPGLREGRIHARTSRSQGGGGGGRARSAPAQ